MAKNDPGAMPCVIGFLFGALAVLGGPAGLVLGGIAAASGYGLGRAIRNSRTKEKKTTSYSSLDFSNLFKKDNLSKEVNITLPEFYDLQQLKKRDQEYNAFNLVNSITATTDTPETPTGIFNLTQHFRRDREAENIYTRINLIADSHSDEDYRPSPVQRRTRSTRQAIYIDEYGQIWE